MWILIGLGACTPHEGTDLPTNPPTLETWPSLLLDDAYSIRDWDDERLLLLHNETGIDDLPMALLHLRTGTIEPLGDAGLGSLHPNGVIRARAVDLWDGDHRLSISGQVSGFGDFAWVGNSPTRVNLETFEVVEDASLSGLRGITPLDDASVAVGRIFEQGQHELFWLTGSEWTPLGTATEVLDRGDPVVFADLNGALTLAAETPVPLGRTLFGSLERTQNGILAETAERTFEAWDGHTWTSIGTDHSVLHRDSEGGLFVDVDGAAVWFQAPHTVLPLNIRVHAARKLGFPHTYVVSHPEDGAHLLLPSGEVLPLPAQVTDDTVFTVDTEDGWTHPQVAGMRPWLIDLDTGQVFEGEEPAQDTCFASFWGQLLYTTASGDLHRLTPDGDQIIGQGCHAFALRDGSTLVHTDRTLRHVDAAGDSEDLGDFVHTRVEVGEVLAVEFADAGTLFEFGRGSVAMFSFDDGAELMRSTYVATDSTGFVLAPERIGDGLLGFFTPGGVTDSGSSIQIRVYDRTGALVQTLPDVAAYAYPRGDEPHFIVHERVNGTDRTRLYNLPH